MKDFLRYLKNFFIFVQKLTRLCTFSLHFLKYGKLQQYKRKSKQEKIFVFGNGPSLAQDIAPFIDLLSQEDVLTVNQFIATDIAHQIRPSFHVMIDPLYFGCYPETDTKEELMEKKERNITLHRALQKIDWEITIFIPHIFHHKSVEFQKNSFIRVQTFNVLQLYTFEKIEKFLYEKNFAIPSGINVVISALCLANYMKYKEIFLLGADNDWHRQIEVNQKDNSIHSNFKHFYQETKNINHSFNLSFYYQCISDLYRAYEKMAQLKFPICNLSSYSMLNTFKRDKLENIIGKKN